MFGCFNDAWSREKKKGISDNKEAEKYWDYLTQIEKTKPDWETLRIPEAGIRAFLYKVVTSKYCDNFIMSIIVLNMVTMAMSYEGSGVGFNNALDLLNYVFTGIFITECMCKLTALGPKGYFYFGWNKFDFFVVSSSIVDITITNTTNAHSAFLKSFQIIRVLRVLRVTRVLRLVKSLKGLEKLLQTLNWSMTALSNVFILMFLVFCIFAIMGCYLYDAVKYQDYAGFFQVYNQYFNLDAFYNAFIFSFRCATGENWPIIMMELASGK